jgi:hypothetical protein
MSRIGGPVLWSRCGDVTGAGGVLSRTGEGASAGAAFEVNEFEGPLSRPGEDVKDLNGALSRIGGAANFGSGFRKESKLLDGPSKSRVFLDGPSKSRPDDRNPPPRPPASAVE